MIGTHYTPTISRYFISGKRLLDSVDRLFYVNIKYIVDREEISLSYSFFFFWFWLSLIFSTFVSLLIVPCILFVYLFIKQKNTKHLYIWDTMLYNIVYFLSVSKIDVYFFQCMKNQTLIKLLFFPWNCVKYLF